MITETIRKGLDATAPLRELIKDCNARLRSCPFGHEYIIDLRCRAVQEIHAVAKDTATCIEKELDV